MEKDHLRINSHGSFVSNNLNGRDRTAVDSSLLLRARSEAAAAAVATRPQPTPSEFVLQWGNGKRLRCMKVQVKARDVSAAAAPVHKTTVRVDRRVVRADRDSIIRQNHQPSPIHNSNHSNGHLNLRQRPISPQPPTLPPPPPAPSQRILRNSEISGVMKGQSNGGVRAITSPDRVAPEKRPPSNHDNHHPHHKSAATSDTKKGGSSSGSGEALAPPSQGQPAWPPKFVIALTNKEKEEDFMAIKGSKLPQRPKKRAKLIQRTINLVSPGTWLCDLTLERYEVREKKISKKRPRGLKAIVNMESDSE
ncbi:uncharacterized protein LOC111492516 [Cucurbita maxima]|uniref:Uncharacterized protein LOC111492516 n=1 Tax=Cucurbita maxima TaxID=3661 RepID=A0A6J1KC32_CUCMA|nr:uncharacterized protein LOC111492516 [Cucurbita maxima]XP_022997650.1 uncharacterized protein LOC111492516 [Cucurbita maxima]XP_022997651.1 uncharacterized protein LOC111492516 [Cucurbita maxima]